jgi:hypothetical protein
LAPPLANPLPLNPPLPNPPNCEASHASEAGWFVPNPIV